MSIQRPKIIFLIFVITFLTANLALPFEGPLQIKNQYPIFIHADQPYMEKAAIENSLSFGLSHSSTYTVQSSGRWLINLDMEITEMSLRYKRIIMDRFEIGIDLPVLIIGGGFLDSPLESFHDSFGFDDYGRSRRPDNEFLYEVRKDGKLIVKGKSGVNLGDIRFSLKRPLLSSDNYTLSLRGDLEIPVSDAEKGYSNESLDAGISLLYDRRITDKIMTYWNAGVVFPGDLRAHSSVDLKNFIYGGVSAEASMGERLSLLLQLQGQSNLFPETDLLAVDREAWLIAIGGRYTVDKGSFEISFTEDINTSGAADFIFNLTYKLKM